MIKEELKEADMKDTDYEILKLCETCIEATHKFQCENEDCKKEFELKKTDKTFNKLMYFQKYLCNDCAVKFVKEKLKCTK